MISNAMTAHRLANQRRMVRARRNGYAWPNAAPHVRQLLQERRENRKSLLAECLGLAS